MQRKPNTRRQTFPTVDGQLLLWLRNQPEDVARLKKQHQYLQEKNRKRIEQLATTLRSDNVLAGIDSTRWRCSTDLALPKIAEAIIETFGEIRLRRGQADGLLSVKDKKDAYRNASIKLRSVGADDRGLGSDAKWLEGHQKNIENSLGYQLYRPTPKAIAECLDKLTMNLVAILSHATNLTEYYILTAILPTILEAAWNVNPDCAPARGKKDSLSRYKLAMSKCVQLSRNTARRTWNAADQLEMFRFLLFAGDDRFPESLFEPHRAVRTVEH
jgi:hypothetical protein